jgi:hypothetical protein
LWYNSRNLTGLLSEALITIFDINNAAMTIQQAFPGTPSSCTTRTLVTAFIIAA